MASSERANWDADDDDDQHSSPYPHAPAEQHVELSHENGGEVPLRPPAKIEVFPPSLLKELLDNTKQHAAEEPVANVAHGTPEHLSVEVEDDESDDEDDEEENVAADMPTSDEPAQHAAEELEAQEPLTHEASDRIEPSPGEFVAEQHEEPAATTEPIRADVPRPFVYEEEPRAEDVFNPAAARTDSPRPGARESTATPSSHSETEDWLFDPERAFDIDNEIAEPLPSIEEYHPAFSESDAEYRLPEEEHGASEAPQSKKVDIHKAIGDAEYRAEKRAASRDLANNLMLVAVGAYLHGKHNRAEAAITKKLDKTAERLDQTTFNYNELNRKTTAQAAQLENFAYQRPPAERFEQPKPVVSAGLRAEQSTAVAPGVELAPQSSAEVKEESVEQAEDGRIILQPGQRLERRGQYSVVVGPDGREVQGAIKYGAEYQRDHRQELTPTSLHNAGNNNGSAVDGDTYVGAVGLGGILSSGQADYSHELPPGHPLRVDANHRLAEPKHPIAAAASSPWLWAALVVLLLAFFAAAFA